MKLYLDNCCWNRPFDLQTQTKVRDQTIAISTIIKICREAGYKIYTSPAVTDEIDAMKTSKPRRWADVRKFHDGATTVHIMPTPDIMARAQGFLSAGLTGKDYFHLAFAEAAGVDFLITTDDNFVGICANDVLSIVNVINPINFLPEVQRWAQ